MARTPIAVLPERERGECTPLESRMRPERAAEVADLLKLLADPTRLQIVVALRDMSESVCVCDCTASFGLSQPTVSHHLARLRDAGLVDVTRKGGWGYYSLRRDLPAATKRLISAL
jgi:ArsR family transcriptional regulator, arsenate/arsenite/antimonite-responsive transcriptional repressor